MENLRERLEGKKNFYSVNDSSELTVDENSNIAARMKSNRRQIATASDDTDYDQERQIQIDEAKKTKAKELAEKLKKKEEREKKNEEREKKNEKKRIQKEEKRLNKEREKQRKNEEKEEKRKGEKRKKKRD